VDIFRALLRIRKLAAAVSTPTFRKAATRGVFASIEHKPAFARFENQFDLIVDVGANKGQFAAFALERFPTSRVVCFEPLSQPAAIFRSIFGSDERVRLVNAAISPCQEDRLINVTEHDDSSSLLEVGDLQSAAFGTRAVRTEEVHCGPLREFVRGEEFGKFNLLKIDVQGFELEVLMASSDYLDRFAVIYCEVSYVTLYKNQACAWEVIEYLNKAGFRLAGVFNQVSLADGLPLQADMIFLREHLLAPVEHVTSL
jgi:FkbM family methyltransferase